ncbi:MAG: hypothetical protein EXS17_06955 [Phycisphaerales bacterium]|nr:hypothetical protein [Phycisphaerales bacterium]
MSSMQGQQLFRWMKQRGPIAPALVLGLLFGGHSAHGQGDSAFRSGKLPEARASWLAFEAQFGASQLSRAYCDAIERGDGSADGVLRLIAK